MRVHGSEQTELKNDVEARNLTAELPLGVFSNGRALAQVSRLPITDLQAGNHAILEIATLKRHGLLVLGDDSARLKEWD